MKITTKQLTQTALLLALCIASQFLKNFSVYITGPIVNIILIIAVLYVGLASGLMISIIAPITAFFISASPITAAVPLIIPAIMIGNASLVFCVWLLRNKRILGLLVGSIAKAILMGVLIVLVLIPLFGDALNDKQIAMASTTFSITQLYTALIGSAIAYLISLSLNPLFKKNKESSL